MKKYHSLSELLKDYREKNKLTQTELSELLNIDVRTIKRWENGSSFLSNRQEREVSEKLFIPYQVIHNLNSSRPLSIYYDIKKRVYSFNSTSLEVKDVLWFKTELPLEDELIKTISTEQDLEFISKIQALHGNEHPLWKQLIISAARILPELNLVLKDQAGFYAGHIAILPLRKETYQKIKQRKITEDELDIKDLTSDLNSEKMVYYYYSLYADSLGHTYFLMKKMLNYFDKIKSQDYTFAGITHRKSKMLFFEKMGIKPYWKKDIQGEFIKGGILMEGTFKKFLER